MVIQRLFYVFLATGFFFIKKSILVILLLHKFDTASCSAAVQIVVQLLSIVAQLPSRVAQLPSRVA